MRDNGWLADLEAIYDPTYSTALGARHLDQASQLLNISTLHPVLRGFLLKKRPLKIKNEFWSPKF